MAIEQQSVILRIKEGEILMKTEAKQVNFLQKIQIPGINSKVGSFLWNFVQMVLAMEAGMLIYMRFIRPLLAPTGFSALTMRYPMFGYWLMVLSMVLGMLALMRFHKCSWRYSLDMTLAMIAPLAVLTVLVLCAVLSIKTLYGIGDDVMFLAMAAFMLYCPHEHAHSGQEQACH
jgi:hypothetical protein